MPRANRAEKRDLILDAAEQVVSEHGIAGATTRRIAQLAGCAEGTLYIHFQDRLELLVALFEKHVPTGRNAMATLYDRVGQGNPTDNLADAFAEVENFLNRAMPLLTGAFSDIALRQAFGKKWKELGFGPENFIGRAAEYIRQEQKLGRVDAGVDAHDGAEVAISKLFYWSFRCGLLENAASHSSLQALRAVAAEILR